MSKGRKPFAMRKSPGGPAASRAGLAWMARDAAWWDADAGAGVPPACVRESAGAGGRYRYSSAMVRNVSTTLSRALPL